MSDAKIVQFNIRLDSKSNDIIKDKLKGSGLSKAEFARIAMLLVSVSEAKKIKR